MSDDPMTLRELVAEHIYREADFEATHPSYCYCGQDFEGGDIAENLECWASHFHGILYEWVDAIRLEIHESGQHMSIAEGPGDVVDEVFARHGIDDSNLRAAVEEVMAAGLVPEGWPEPPR